MTATDLPTPIASYLAAHAAARRRVAVVRAGAGAAAFGLGWLLLTCGVDRAAALPAGARLASLALGAAGAAGLVAGPAWRWARARPDPVEAAEAAERADGRFGQRLATLASQFAQPPGRRGSAQLLAAVAERVAQDVAAAPRPGGAAAPLRAAAAPTAVALLAAATITLLCFVPESDILRLIDRALFPLSGAGAVTATDLDVQPRDLLVDPGRAFDVVARATPLRRGETPLVHWRAAGGEGAAGGAWSTAAMGPSGTDLFARTFPPAGPDLEYFVTAGDARSDTYAVRVSRVPQLAGLRVSYAYPAATRWPPRSAEQPDGQIDAPAGTEATLVIRSTEALRDAALDVGGAALATEPTADPRARRATLRVDRDAPLSLAMTTTLGIGGAGPAGMRLRALPDRPPTARLDRPEDGARLSPTDVVVAAYAAEDDYGLAALTLRARVSGGGGGGGERAFALPVPSDARSVAGETDVPLSALSAVVGDVVEVELTATDTAGQSRAAAPRRVRVAREADDADARARVAQFRKAAAAAAAAGDDLRAAAAGIDAARQGGAPAPAAIEARRRGASAAAEAAEARDALLRAIAAGASPALADATARWADAAQQAVTVGGRGAAFDPAAPADDLRDALTGAATAATGLREGADLFAVGEQATLALAEVQADRPAALQGGGGGASVAATDDYKCG